MTFIICGTPQHHLEQGAQPKHIQEIMGHSSIKVTFDIYGHLFADAEADQALMAAAERRLFGLP